MNTCAARGGEQWRNCCKESPGQHRAPAAWLWKRVTNHESTPVSTGFVPNLFPLLLGILTDRMHGRSAEITIFNSPITLQFTPFFRTRIQDRKSSAHEMI